MQVAKLRICNFRGIKFSSVLLPPQGVIIGDNNAGKSSIFEALDLVLGPDRLSRRAPINEHDFFENIYFHPEEDKPNPKIRIDATVSDLDDEQSRRFSPHLEFWDTEKQRRVITLPGIESPTVQRAVRVTFVGEYDEEEDDFIGKTYFTRTLQDETPTEFRKSDKRVCGFLYLRPVRTGSRALSLEHGSLLDIILRIKELRPRIWENIISSLEATEVATDNTVGVTDVLDGIQTALNKYVPEDWGTAPRLKVSNLTRENLRKVITAFITDPISGTSLPFYRQGTGTINMLVLSMLTMIAEGREGKVIFAMEEPETAIPPYSQKRIVSEIRKLSAQALFTSHSPYVIEEFEVDETVLLQKKPNSKVLRRFITLPKLFNRKMYRQNFRQKFCECLLAKRIIIAEGVTEEGAIIASARRLANVDAVNFKSLESLGVAVYDADGETNIARAAEFFRGLGKRVMVICDQQNPQNFADIQQHTEALYMHGETSTEKVVIAQAAMTAKLRFLTALIADGLWKPHMVQLFPNPLEDADNALERYLNDNKGNWAVADFLSQCDNGEMPKFFRDTCFAIRTLFAPLPPTPQLMPGATSPPTATTDP